MLSEELRFRRRDSCTALFCIQIKMAKINLPQNRPIANAKRTAIKAYAVTANTRLASASEIPTVDEAGLPGFYIPVWSDMWAPKGPANCR
jgi:tripartite-type tricarboxylate transporter receptor subunit TctC